MERKEKMTSRHEEFRRRLRDQGPVNLKTHPSKKREGEITNIAKSPAVTMAPTTPIYEAVRIMAKEGFRRMHACMHATQEQNGYRV